MTRRVPAREQNVPGENKPFPRHHSLAERGKRAREQRESIFLPIDLIAKRAGISKSKASEIERGIAVPDEQLVFCYEQGLRMEAASVMKIAADIVVEPVRYGYGEA